MEDIEDEIMDGILDDKEQLGVYEVLLEISQKSLDLYKTYEQNADTEKQIKLKEKIIEHYLDVIQQKKERIASQE